MRIIARSRADGNRALLDPWTVVHLGTGLAAGLVQLDARTAFGLAIAYELGEQVFERSPAGRRSFRTSGPESLPNVLADLAVFGLGWYLGRRWK